MSIAFICLVLLLVCVSEARVDAYLDPGSGSMLVQLLLGGVAGVAVIARLGWQRFRDLFRPRESKPEGQPKSHE
jgi:hypothetical protein